MLKTKRKTYGNTPWGRAWVEAMERIDSNRLARGKTYANTGRVLSVSVASNLVSARVKGSYYDSYEIKIALTPFSKKDILILQDIVSQQPSLSIELSLGSLPAILLALLSAKGISLLPTRWKDLQARCSCPDSSNPCKHLAAVYYILANEIDRDPFLLFNLKGLSTAELTGMFQATPTIQTEPREHPVLAACVPPEALTAIPNLPKPGSFSFSFPRHNIRPVLSLLPDQPPFYTEGNFKDFLENLYHLVPTEVERLFSQVDENPVLANRLFQLEWFQDDYSPRHLCRLKIAIEKDQFALEKQRIQAALHSEFEPETQWLWCLGTTDTRFKPTAFEALSLGDLGSGLDYFLCASLNIESSQASESFLFLNQAASLALALVRANLFVPDLLYENQDAFRIRYVPLVGQSVVEAVITQLAQAMPRDIAHFQMQFLSKDGIPEILSLFITHVIHTILARQSFPRENRVLNLFSENYLFRPSRFTEQRIGPSIANWLEKLHLGKRDITPVIRIETTPRESFKVFVDVLNRKSALDPMVPFARLLEKAPEKRKKQSELFGRPVPEVQREVSRQLIIAGDYMPELKSIVDGQGAMTPVVTLERMSELLLETANLLDVLGIHLILPKALKKLVSPHLQMKAKLRKSNETGASYLTLDEMLTFSYEIALGEETVSAQDFRKLIKQTGGLVKFKDQYVLLRPDEVQDILRKLKEPLPDLSSPMQALYAAMTGEVRGLRFHPDEALQRVLDDLTRVEEVAIPTSLNATLRPYQERGFRWLWTNHQKGFGSCMADDMGLGKTIQIITLLLHAKNQVEQQNKAQVPSLVVCPTTLIGNWAKECARFAPSLNVSIYHGHERKLDLKQVDVVITSFGVFRRDLAKFSTKAWAFLIVDEAQNIKNSETAQTKAIKSLKANNLIAMTGTPVENRLTELWNLFDFINPGYLGNLSQFKTELANPIEKARDPQTIEKLKRATAPFLLRRLKTDKSIIIDLPDKLTMDDYCYLTQEQAAIYQNVVDTILKDIQSSEGIERKGLIFKLITTLKQICNHPAHFANQGSVSSDLSGKAAKTMDTLRGILENGEKALIFTQYREMGDLLVQMIQDELDTTALFFHGGLHRAKRDEMVQTFQEDRHSRLMILSLKAGGTGLNLTAASNVIHYDLWWNPAVENQATDRAYRIGQNRNVLVHRLITLGTFEEKIDEMIKAKQELANLTVATGENWITELSNQQLKEIFTLSANMRA